MENRRRFPTATWKTTVGFPQLLGKPKTVYHSAHRPDGDEESPVLGTEQDEERREKGRKESRQERPCRPHRRLTPECTKIIVANAQK